MLPCGRAAKLTPPCGTATATGEYRHPPLKDPTQQQVKGTKAKTAFLLFLKTQEINRRAVVYRRLSLAPKGMSWLERTRPWECH